MSRFCLAATIICLTLFLYDGNTVEINDVTTQSNRTGDGENSLNVMTSDSSLSWNSRQLFKATYRLLKFIMQFTRTRSRRKPSVGK